MKIRPRDPRDGAESAGRRDYLNGRYRRNVPEHLAGYYDAGFRSKEREEWLNCKRVWNQKITARERSAAVLSGGSGMDRPSPSQSFSTE